MRHSALANLKQVFRLKNEHGTNHHGEQALWHQMHLLGEAYYWLWAHAKHECALARDGHPVHVLLIPLLARQCLLYQIIAP